MWDPILVQKRNILKTLSTMVNFFFRGRRGVEWGKMIASKKIGKMRILTVMQVKTHCIPSICFYTSVSKRKISLNKFGLVGVQIVYNHKNLHKLEVTVSEKEKQRVMSRHRKWSKSTYAHILTHSPQLTFSIQFKRADRSRTCTKINFIWTITLIWWYW